MAVGGTGVAVGGTGVAVGGSGVDVGDGGTGVAVGGTSVGVGCGVGVDAGGSELICGAGVDVGNGCGAAFGSPPWSGGDSYGVGVATGCVCPSSLPSTKLGCQSSGSVWSRSLPSPFQTSSDRGWRLGIASSSSAKASTSGAFPSVVDSSFLQAATRANAVPAASRARRVFGAVNSSVVASTFPLASTAGASSRIRPMLSGN